MTPALERRGDWLLFDAPAPTGAPHAADPGALLVSTGRLAGGCKFARTPGEPRLRVRAELAALAEAPERRAEVEAGFAQAAGELGIDACDDARTDAPADEPAPDLEALCHEAGWPGDAREDGSLTIDLDVAGAYVPACLRIGEAGVVVEAELVAELDAEGPSCEALAELLLRANGFFRMARGVLRPAAPGGAPEAEGPSRLRALLEVPLPRTPVADELREALGALAVAARRCAREAQLLAGHAGLAREYLALQAPPQNP